MNHVGYSVWPRSRRQKTHTWYFSHQGLCLHLVLSNLLWEKLVNNRRESKWSENTKCSFPLKYGTRDSEKTSAPVVFHLGDISVPSLHTHRCSRTLLPRRSRSIWSGLSLMIFSRWFSRLFIRVTWKACKPSGTWRQRSQTPGFVNRLLGRGSWFQTSLPSNFTSTPLRTTTLGKHKAKMEKAAAASSPGDLGKGGVCAFTLKRFLICRWSSFERNFCSLISAQK